MQVILREDVPSLGDAGAVVKVRSGYARNYLLPQRLAVVADANNVKKLEHEQRVVAAQQAKVKAEKESIAKTIKGVTLTFEREAGEDGRLFGSVTNQDVAAALKAQDIEVDRRRIKMADAIKALGEYSAEIRLHAEVTAACKIVVTQQA